MRNSFYVPLPGAKLQELRCRCDFCHWSGPFTQFDLWGKDDQDVFLCYETGCASAQSVCDELLKEGWHKL